MNKNHLRLGDILLALGVLVFAGIFLFGLFSRVNYQEKYEELQEKYDELQYQLEESELSVNTVEEKYSGIIHSTEDAMTVLYEYFEEESTSFDDAYSAYESLSEILHPFY